MRVDRLVNRCLGGAFSDVGLSVFTRFIPSSLTGVCDELGALSCSSTLEGFSTSWLFLRGRIKDNLDLDLLLPLTLAASNFEMLSVMGGFWNLTVERILALGVTTCLSLSC